MPFIDFGSHIVFTLEVHYMYQGFLILKNKFDWKYSLSSCYGKLQNEFVTSGFILVFILTVGQYWNGLNKYIFKIDRGWRGYLLCGLISKPDCFTQKDNIITSKAIWNLLLMSFLQPFNGCGARRMINR